MKSKNNLHLTMQDIKVIDRYSTKYLSDCYDKSYAYTVSLESKNEQQINRMKINKEKY